MKHLWIALSLSAASLAAPLPAAAAPGGELGTLPLGRYTCGLPGDALGPAIRHVPEADFAVIAASSYRADDGRGSYLRTGDRVVMTSGPRQGQRFRVDSGRLLHRLEANGGDGTLSCGLGPTPVSGLEAICPIKDTE
ncbi:MAG TPA: hypothetical protein VJM34_11390 [Novosphingobium sp.]|nr:hypothetical protein [Novosphingobium sp.]